MKIGFLAMSGLRAHDPELLQLGMTLPGILQRGKVVASLPSLGLLYLAAVTPSGHALHYFEAPTDGEESDQLYECDLVAISTFSAQIFEAYAIADRLRRAGVVVAMGGLHVSVEPEEAARHADVVILGEGENVWPDVVRAVEAGRCPPRWDSQQFPLVELGLLPTPRYDLLRDRAYHRFPVQTSRGCPWHCDFCASTVMLQRPYRKRPVEQVIRDLRVLMELYRRPFIEFADDNTFVDHAWGRELCRQMIPLKLKWFTETDISVADDEELLRLMRESRCRQLLIGLESPRRQDLVGIEMRSDFKARRWSTYRDSLRRIQEQGITVNGCFILGLDGEGPEIFEEILEFALVVPLYEVQITVLTPFPGTDLYRRLLAEDRLLHPRRWDLCTLFDVNFKPTHMTPQELREGMYWLAERLFNEDCMERRRRPFFDALWRKHERLTSPASSLPLTEPYQISPR